MTREQEIKLANFEEQYSSIRTNIDAANEELGNVLLLKRTAEEELSTVAPRVESARREIEETLRLRDSVLEEVSNLQSQLAQLEQEHAVSVARKQGEMSAITAAHAARADALNKRLSKFNDRINYKTEYLARLDADIVKAKEAIEIENNTLAGLRKDRAEESRELSNVIALKDNALREIRDLDAEIESRNAVIAEQNDSISGFKDNVMRTYESIATRIKDITILQMRLKRAYEQLGVQTDFEPLEVPQVPKGLL